MIGAIFTALTTIGESFLQFFIGLLTSVFAIFYTPAAEGQTVGQITDIGYLVLAGTLVSFVFFAIRWITRLVKLKG